MREIDGHDLSAIVRHATDIPFEAGKPSLLLANTVKSRGLSFAEGKVEYHYWTAKPEELDLADRDLQIDERG